MLVRRSAKFRGNSWRKSCEESRRKGAAARPSGTRFGKLRLRRRLYLPLAPAERMHPSAAMAAKPRPHTLARAADRSSVRTPPPPPPIPGKVRVTPARTGGPSHRYVVGKNKLWFANATRTPPPQAPRTASPRRFSRPCAGAETALKCQDRRDTISLDCNNCVQCTSKLRGACGCCTRSSLVQKKCCALGSCKAQRHRSAQRTQSLHTDCCLASGREQPILRRRRRPPQPHPRP